MARFLIRSFLSAVITMLLVSIALFTLLEIGSGDIAVKILGVFATEEQKASYRAQLGLNAPPWQRYLDWLIGNDWRAESMVARFLLIWKTCPGAFSCMPDEICLEVRNFHSFTTIWIRVIFLKRMVCPF